MGFSAEGRHLYFVEPAAGEILRFAYDVAAGELGKGHRFVDVGHEDGVPAGVAVDAEGCLWCAFRGSGCLVRYDGRGREVARLDLPVQQVTDLAFGGARLEDLYVTTASDGDHDVEGDGSGALFRVRPGVPGCPGFASRIDL